MHNPASVNPPLEQLELVVARAAFDPAVRGQLLELDRCAFGPVRWRRTNEGPQMLVERLEVGPAAGQGGSPRADDCFLALYVENAAHGWTARELLARLTPQPSQRAAALVIYPGAPARWDAAAQLGRQGVVPVDVVRVSGPAPLALSRDEQTQEWQTAAERWSRTAGALGAEAFARACRLRVDLIGAGRNGSQCAQQLAALGVAQIRLIDGDRRLEEHNLVGTLGLDAADLGAPKTRAVAKSLVRLRPELAVTCFERPVHDPEMFDELRRRRADLVVSCVDDDTARLAAWLVAQDALVPHLDIASAVLHREGRTERLADVRLFLPGGGQGCPVCVGGVGDLDDALYALNAPPGSLHRGRATPWHDERAGSLAALNSLAVGAGINLLVDYLRGELRTSAWQRLRWTPRQGLEGNFAAAATDPQCAFCGHKPAAGRDPARS